MPLTSFESLFPTLCRRLRQTKLTGRTGQAYLLVGDDIEFLEKFAMVWAQTAACVSPNSDGSACGDCDSCIHFIRHSYPECYVVRPQSKSRRITVEDMRDFEHDISLSARPGYLKIGMIVEADRLGTEAQNAFLKTLEEPPPHTMLILLTVNPKMLLPTTKSRCQVLSLLRNRQDYSSVAQQGLFEILSTLHRRAGVMAGIRAAAGISQILERLHADAVLTVKANRDTTWDNVDDNRMEKQQKEEMAAKIEAEYVKLRDGVLGAIHSWFLQRLIWTNGGQQNSLPNPEMFEGVTVKASSPEEAAQDITYAEEFIRSLGANVNEKLALDAFCLSVTEKC